jgi:general secretion pathway protein A
MKEKTFNLSPDHEYFYMSKGHEDAYTHLEYAINENKGFAVITGEIGSGKTTLVNYFLYKTKLDFQIGLINNTNIPASQFLKAVCNELEIDSNFDDKIGLMDSFQNYLLKQYSEKNRVILIIDEAQNLSPKIMEEIRMMSNLESEKNHLMQIVLFGQPELKYKLQRMDLKQFAQRVSVHFHLKGLEKDEVQHYIRYRLKVGGTKNVNLFNDDAVDLIYLHSKGIPRIINIICDTALVYGYADSLKVITKKVIEEVIKERDQSGIFEEFDNNEIILPFKDDQREHRQEKSNHEQQMLVEKIGFLENNIKDIKRDIRYLNNIHNKRDRIIFDLFKMLEDSIKSRAHLLQIINHLLHNKHDKVQKDNEKDSQNIAILRG